MAEKIIHLLVVLQGDGWSAGRLYVADNRFLNLDGPIHAARIDHQMIQARIFGYIRDTSAFTLVFYRFLQRTTAHRAVYHDTQ